jgi:hypothetical protein
MQRLAMPEDRAFKMETMIEANAMEHCTKQRVCV